MAEEKIRCRHNPLDYIRLYPVGADLRTGNPRVALNFLLECPNNAVEGSEFCMPHSILRTTEHQLSADQLLYVEKFVNFCAHGLLITPPLPDGTFVYPKWWGNRFN